MRTRGPAAVGAEVRAPRERRAALAPHAAAARCGGDQRVELVQPLVECDEVCAPLRHELDAEPVPAEHLEDDSAQVADPILPFAQQRAPLALQRRRMVGASRRLAGGGARAITAERPQACHRPPNLANWAPPLGGAVPQAPRRITPNPPR